MNPSFVAHADESDAEIDAKVKVDDDDHKSVGTFEGGGVGYHGEDDINSEDDDSKSYNGVCDLKGTDLENAIDRCLHPEVYINEKIAAPIVSFVSNVGPDIISAARRRRLKFVVDLNLQILAEATVENNDDIGKSVTL